MGITIVLPLLGILWGAGKSPPEDVSFLRKVAQDLMREGQPSKALVLLQRARALDSLQMDIDHLMNQCRAKLGGWVAPDASADWSEVDGLMDKAIREKPDSMFKVANVLAESDDIAGALRIDLLLSRSSTANAAYLDAYKDLKKKQETKVEFHREQADQAMSRGRTSEALAQWRMAFATRPDDIALQDMVEKADRACQLSLLSFQTGLQRCLTAVDASCALDVLGKARVAHPENPRFKTVEDSLKAQRKEFYSARFRRIDAQADSGMDRDAMEAMESLVAMNPGDPVLSQALDALQDRIQRRRKAAFLDSLGREFDNSMRQGDLRGAEATINEMRSRGAVGERTDRLRERLDSVRARERNAVALNEALALARRQLGRGDTASAKVALRKALSIQPDNALAKGVLASVNAVRPPPVQSQESSRSRSVVASAGGEDAGRRVNELVLAGVSAYRSGEYKNAMERWKQALEIDPKCVQAQRYLANVGQKQARLQ